MSKPKEPEPERVGAGAVGRGGLAVATKGVPGKVTVQPKHPIGDDAVDHGAACTGAPESEVCFLDEGQRVRLLVQLSKKMQRAENNYKLAIAEVRVNELLGPDEDVSPMTAMILDLMIGHCLGTMIAGLATLQARGVKALEERASVGLDLATENDGFSALATERMTGVLTGFATGRKAATLAGMKAAAGREQKAPTTDVLAILSDRVSEDFSAMEDMIPAQSNDRELVWLLYSFADVHAHSQTAYVGVVREFVARFKASAVSHIGPTSTGYGEHVQSGPAVWRNLGVKRVRYMSGYPSEIHWTWPEPDEDGLETRGSRDNPDPTNSLKGSPIVPAEFVEYAVARHEARWGTPPSTTLVDESMIEAYWVHEPQRALKAQRERAREERLNHVEPLRPGEVYGPSATPTDMTTMSKDMLDLSNVHHPKPFAEVRKREPQPR